jgi:mRNA interferase MazF
MREEQYQKDFDGWIVEKQRRHYELMPKVYFHTREAWWCALGVNIGFEQDGKKENYSRPVVILNVFSTNACLVVPLTSKEKEGRFYFDLGIVAGRNAKAVISQIRFIDKRRLINKADVVKEETFAQLQKAIVQENFSKSMV